MTDHGWLLMPGGLPKVELPPSLTATKWARCARCKASRTRSASSSLALESGSADCLPAGIGCFIAGAEYAHGGVSLQECVIPDLTVERGAEVAGPRLRTSVARHALRVRASTSVPGLHVDLRTTAKQPRPASWRPLKSLDANGEASLVVSDDKHEGAAAVSSSSTAATTCSIASRRPSENS